jgi:hypothetical protein
MELELTDIQFNIELQEPILNGTTVGPTSEVCKATMQHNSFVSPIGWLRMNVV